MVMFQEGEEKKCLIQTLQQVCHIQRELKTEK